jgi:hypothetical protein
MSTTNEEPLSAYEAEHIVENLQKFTLAQVGSPKYLLQHANMEKLSVQANKNLANSCEEYITSSIITFQKVFITN